MKLAVITSGFLPVPATKGGAVENLIENFLNVNEIEKKINPIVFSIYDDKAFDLSKKYKISTFIFIKPSPIVKTLDKFTYFVAKKVLKKENSQTYRYIFQRLHYLNKVSKYLKKNNYDKILLENHPTQYLALKWRNNYKKYDGRYYYHCHNEFPGKYGCDEIINKTEKFICISNFISDSLQKYLNLPKEKFRISRNAIDESKFNIDISEMKKNKIKKKYGINSNTKILLFTGRIVKEKGIEELINALKFVKYEDYKLLVVGASLNDIKVKTNFEEKIEKLVIEEKEKIIFSGYVGYDEIYKYYKIADIAVLPSIWEEPAGLTIIESLVCGLPIITTNSGGIPEYVNENCAVILERDENLTKNIAKEIDKLLIDDKRRQKMSIEAKKVSEGMSIEEYYNSLMSNII